MSWEVLQKSVLLARAGQVPSQRLAQEEVDGGEGGQLLAEQARHHVFRQARAPAQVEGGEGGGEGVGAAHQLPEAPWSLAPW